MSAADSMNPENMGVEDGTQEVNRDPGQGIAGVMQAGLSTPGISGGTAQPAAAPRPTDAPKKHGGLLTGLVGVLLDGLSAGIRTPQGPQGFSQSADLAARLPMQRQQQAMQFQTQQEMQKAQMAQAHVQQLQARLMASSLDDQVASGLSDAAWKFATNSVEQGVAKKVAGDGTREAAFDKLKELHDTGDPSTQGNLFAYPSGKSKDGTSTWSVYEAFPNKTLTEDFSFDLPGDPDNGVEAVHKVFPAGTPMSVVTATTAQLSRDHVAKLHTAAQQAIAENKADPTDKIERMVGGKPHTILINKRTGADIRDEGETQPRSSAAAATPQDIATQAKMLVEGDLDPSQVSKRSGTQGAILSAANDYSQKTKGKPYDAAQQQADYKYATNVQTQNTLKYLNSLTGNDNKSGNLGTLVSMSDKITRTQFPALNDLAAWSRLQSGDPAIAQYKAAVTEVADQVAKILQGGGSGSGTSDVKLKQAQDMFQNGFNKDQIKGVATTLRDLLANRKREMIGDNVYLNKQYGRSVAAANRDQQNPPAGATMKVPDKQGRMHWSDGKKDLGLVNP